MNCPLVRRIYDRFEEIGVNPGDVPVCIVNYLQAELALVYVIRLANGKCVWGMTQRTKKALNKLYR